jgi:hypothetical protein
VESRSHVTSALCPVDRCKIVFSIFNNLLREGVFQTFNIGPSFVSRSEIIIKNVLILQGATVRGLYSSEGLQNTNLTDTF